MIVLIDWNLGGHHESYLATYSSILLRQGNRLLVLCRDPLALRASLAVRVDASLFAMLETAAIQGPKWIRARRKWPLGLAYAIYARGVLRELKRGEANAGGDAAEVFFCCLYEHQTRMIDAVVRGLGGRTWSGLYLHAHAFHSPESPAPGVKRKWPISRLWRHRGLRGVLMLDEAMAAQVSTAIRRPVHVFPDITDATVRSDEPLTAEMSAFASGRSVVGLFGHLVPSKGIVSLARCALAPGMGNMFFAFVGEVHWEMFSSEDRALLGHLKSGHPNVWFYDERIPDEAAYNSLFRACDVIYAAYENFPHSSNTLTKAAVFRKPVLVHEGSLMAARVRHYRLGEVLPQDSSTAARCEALVRLAGVAAEWSEVARPDWLGYQSAHSEERLAEVLGRFFGRPPEPDAPSPRNVEK